MEWVHFTIENAAHYQLANSRPADRLMTESLRLMKLTRKQISNGMELDGDGAASDEVAMETRIMKTPKLDGGPNSTKMESRWPKFDVRWSCDGGGSTQWRCEELRCRWSSQSPSSRWELEGST